MRTQARTLALAHPMTHRNGTHGSRLQPHLCAHRHAQHARTRTPHDTATGLTVTLPRHIQYTLLIPLLLIEVLISWAAGCGCIRHSLMLISFYLRSERLGSQPFMLHSPRARAWALLIHAPLRARVNRRHWSVGRANEPEPSAPLMRSRIYFIER